MQKTTPAGGWTPPESDDPTGGPRALLRRVGTPALNFVRRFSSLTVAWTPPRLGGGNHLYMWLHAYTQSKQGKRFPVLQRPGMESWLEMFPRLREITIAREAVPFTANREEIWNQAYRLLSSAEIKEFAQQYIFSSPTFSRLLQEAEDFYRDNDCLVLNIRRGDYYTNPEFFRSYGMDLRFYLNEVLSQHPGRTVSLISDDPQWCADTVPGWFPELKIVAPQRESGPFHDLAYLVTAPSLALTNSTFSYWSGYLKNALDSEKGKSGPVYAPLFHARSIIGGKAFQLSPDWQVIDNLRHEMERDLTPEGEEHA
ncbi:alpha-1,2-fucosyltransferase [Dermabacteraceae bacterium P13136]